MPAQPAYSLVVFWPFCSREPLGAARDAGRVSPYNVVYCLYESRERFKNRGYQVSVTHHHGFSFTPVGPVGHVIK